MSKNESSEKTKRSLKSFGNLSSAGKRYLLLFVMLFAAIGVYALLQSNAAPRNTAAVTLSLSPSSQRLAVGQTVNLAVRLNTNGQTVNAVQANLNYPTDRFEFVGFDPTGSAFEIEAEATGGGGSVKIARGSIPSVNSSDALVSTVILKAIGPGRKVKVSFADSSAVIRTSDSTNVLQRLTGGSYTIQ